MKIILIHSLSHQNGLLFNPNDRDNCMEPYIILRNKLINLGYHLDTADDHSIESCEWVIFIEIPSALPPYRGLIGKLRYLKHFYKKKPKLRDLYKECLQAGKKIALILDEGKSVCLIDWDLNLHKMFPLIFTWNDDLIDGQKYHKICAVRLPSKYPIVPEIPFSKKKLLVNISMNKYSSYYNELYSARRESIRYFEHHRPRDFDLYGIGWNQPVGRLQKFLPFFTPRYSSYRGIIKNKWDVLPYYRFSICYENTKGDPGYITEKIFDSMRCGCVPIYWGASNITDYVYKEAFIDRRHFPSNQDVEDYITGISETEYNHFQKAIKEYLNSSSFAKFLPQAFADTIIKVLNL